MLLRGRGLLRQLISLMEECSLLLSLPIPIILVFYPRSYYLSSVSLFLILFLYPHVPIIFLLYLYFSYFFSIRISYHRLSLSPFLLFSFLLYLFFSVRIPITGSLSIPVSTILFLSYPYSDSSLSLSPYSY